MPDYGPVRPGGYVRAGAKVPLGRPACTFCGLREHKAGAVLPMVGSPLVLIACVECLKDPAIQETVDRRLAASPEAVELPEPGSKLEPPTEAEMVQKHGMVSDDPSARGTKLSWQKGQKEAARANDW